MYKLCAQHSASCTPLLLSLNLATKGPENISTETGQLSGGSAARPCFASEPVRTMPEPEYTVMSERFSCISSTGQGRRM
ncbi:hypothetical protein An07g02220 [Aspergillus niger]|uniref:Uncharacterized protein n=2 Tax=Aspergillus niger TaxID=5061 RepID=A2QMI5_ASPNC|nr:hypothetical protein An07g02220 [Aspergillus niger]CAK39313.1 hypothetical protein An07g02220 [Aspergillus niger]